MVRGGWDGQLEKKKKKKLGVREKKSKGESKKEENNIKKGENALKCIFFGYKLRPARCKLICREKNESPKRGGGMIRMHNIYP